MGRMIKRTVTQRGTHPNSTTIEVVDVEGFGFDYVVKPPQGWGMRPKTGGCYWKSEGSARKAALADAYEFTTGQGQPGRFKWERVKEEQGGGPDRKG